ncbi:3-oxoadipate enol-lactonase [Beijerinckia indica]|uniref:3-oxoadipate enol-lactonase n=1 Tax=Beijerinckia indica subsp. indica (strain ATCC 9039 / DSM 1715 / NCIMB 8712) TaxID=395963 RepID=B2IKJ2_BEII9|nr:3-oxoadipate enol-lactonase [Beijerinckia indica]ACB96472.1 3-oxoadipate enol-lactonase [Beijerinckia indica subsp. indica ATCC 9039]
MTQILVAGRSFHVQVEGQEALPVLMLAHPLGADLGIWNALIEALLPHFRIVRYDARGHGGSSVVAGPYSIADLGRDALGLMDALGLDQVHWLGQSMGGMVGQWLLAHAPERIERAVLANTTARSNDPNVWNQRIATVRIHGMKAIAEAVLERWFTSAFRTANPALIEPIRQTLLRTTPEGYIACCAAIRDMDLHEAIRAVEQSVLVIMGQDDPSTPPTEGLAIAEAIEAAQTLLLEAAHISHIEANAPFTKAVVDFLTAPTRKLQSRRGPAIARSTARRPTSPRKTLTPVQVDKPPVKRTTTKPVPKKVATKAAPQKQANAPKSAVKKSLSRKGPPAKILDKSIDRTRDQGEKTETVQGGAKPTKSTFSRRPPTRRK